MRTDDLIAALASDTKPAASPKRALLIGIAAAIAIAALVFAIVLGPRHDFMAAAGTIRFLFKFVVTLTLAASAFVLIARLARPEARAPRAILLAAPALLIAAIVLEMMAVPAHDWAARLIGHNARVCLLSIPLLSLGPLFALLVALRSGAPGRPAFAGAVAGLLAAGIGATFYAAHCFDDSPLFVATWYTLAAVFMAAIGAFLGSRVLRW